MMCENEKDKHSLIENKSNLPSWNINIDTHGFPSRAWGRVRLVYVG